MKTYQRVPVYNMKIKHKTYFVGATLPEMLIVLMISMLIVSILVSLLMRIHQYRQQQQQQLQLQNQVHKALQLMSKDLRRAGYHAVKQENNLALFQIDGKSIQLNQEKSSYYQCVMFFYDLNMDGCIGSQRKNQACIENGRNSSTKLNEELFGYRYGNNNIEMLLMEKNSFVEECRAEECQRHLNNSACTAKRWYKLLPESYIVEMLKFNWLPEKKGVQITLKVYLNEQKQIAYQATALVPLLSEVQNAALP